MQSNLNENQKQTRQHYRQIALKLKDLYPELLANYRLKGWRDKGSNAGYWKGRVMRFKELVDEYNEPREFIQEQQQAQVPIRMVPPIPFQPQQIQPVMRHGLAPLPQAERILPRPPQRALPPLPWTDVTVTIRASYGDTDEDRRNQVFIGEYQQVIRFQSEEDKQFQIDQFKHEIEFVHHYYPLYHIAFLSIRFGENIVLPMENEERKTDMNPWIEDEEMLEYHFGYDYLPLGDNDQFGCAFNYIWNKYSPLIINCRKCLCKFNIYHFMEILGVQSGAQGVSCTHIQRFAEHFNIPHYAIDITGAKFHSYRPDNRNQNLPVLSYCVANNHFYPITSANFIKSIAHKTVTKKIKIDAIYEFIDVFNTNKSPPKTSKKPKEPKKEPKKPKKVRKTVPKRSDVFMTAHEFQLEFGLNNLQDKNIFITELGETSFLERIYMYVFRMQKQFCVCTSKGGVMQSMYNKKYNLRIRAPPDDIPCEQVVAYCKEVQQPYFGQSMQSILFKTSKIVKSLQKSSTNIFTKNIIETWDIQPIVEKYIATTRENADDSVTIDFTRHYENTARQLKKNIAVPTCFDKVECVKTGERLRDNCWYYIETESDFPFRRSGWYCYEFLFNIKKLDSALWKTVTVKRKIVCSEIEKNGNIHALMDEIYTEMQVGVRDIDKNMFKQFLTTRKHIEQPTYKKIAEKNYQRYSHDDKLAKNVTRRIIGLFNKIDLPCEKLYFFTNKGTMRRMVEIKGDGNEAQMGILKNDNNNVYMSVLDEELHGINGLKIYQATAKSRLKKQYSYRHIYKTIIDMSTFRLFKLYTELKKLDPNLQLMNLKVDCLTVISPKIAEMKRNGQLTINDRFNTHYEEVPLIEVGQLTTEKVRLEAITPEIVDETWTQITTREQIEELIDLRQSFMNNGLAGTGKTYTIKKIIIPYLEENGIEYVKMAPTHIASLIIGGETIASTFMMDPRNQTITKQSLSKLKEIEYFIIDEMSLINGKCWFIIKMLKEHGFKFIISGDAEQLLGVQDKEVDYTKTLLVKWICDFNIHTNQYDPAVSRYDDGLYKLCNKILFDDKCDLLKHVPMTDKISAEYVNVCLTNERRISINHKIMIAKKKTLEKEDYVVIRYTKSELYPKDVRQNTILYVGLPIIARKTTLEIDYEIHNNEPFVVTGLSEGVVTLKSEMMENSTVVLTHEEFKKLHLCPRFALTIWGVQGLTIKTPIVFFEYDLVAKPWGMFRRNKRRILYTFVSRATGIGNVFISSFA